MRTFGWADIVLAILAPPTRSEWEIQAFDQGFPLTVRLFTYTFFSELPLAESWICFPLGSLIVTASNSGLVRT